MRTSLHLLQIDRVVLSHNNSSHLKLAKRFNQIKGKRIVIIDDKDALLMMLFHSIKNREMRSGYARRNLIRLLSNYFILLTCKNRKRIDMKESFVKRMNTWGKEKKPFLFIFDFEGNEGEIIPLDQVNSSEIKYNFEGQTNAPDSYEKESQRDFYFTKCPISYETFEKSFSKVKSALLYGNSFLTNLTFPTPIKTNLSLPEIYSRSTAKYKLLYRDQFVVFSPEIFVKIKQGKIASYPMKGTIDANLPNAKETILKDEKETAEHHTIVDLIRNDLSQIARNVKVAQFRYIDEIKTNQKHLLQVSSKVIGDLDDNYYENLGTIFEKLLPAGSITGAPKKRTVEIIKDAELCERGFYTGVMGIFDGKDVKSSVMIRYIEKQNNELIFKSGGGITVFSNPQSEYHEMTDKVYVPISRNTQN